MGIEKRQDSELDLITLAEAAKVVGYTPEYLNMLARQKKLEALKIGRNWMTTKTWVEEFFHPELKAGRLAAEAEQREAEQEEIAQREAMNKEAFRAILEELQDEDGPLRKVEDEAGKLENFNFDEIREVERIKQRGFFKFFRGSRTSQRWWQSSRVFSLAVIAILIFLGSAQTLRIKYEINNNADIATQLPTEEGKAVVLDWQENPAAQVGVVLGIETEKKVLLASENFKIKQANFGGDAILLANDTDNLPVEILNVKSESYLNPKGTESRISISWQSNKLTRGTLEISKSGEQSPKNISESSFGFNHHVLVTGLDSGVAYIYKIKSHDRWGNETESDYFGVYAGAKPVSIFELIGKSFGDIFGWALEE